MLLINQSVLNIQTLLQFYWRYVSQIFHQCLKATIFRIGWLGFKDYVYCNLNCFLDKCNTQKRVKGMPPWQQENHFLVNSPSFLFRLFPPLSCLFLPRCVHWLSVPLFSALVRPRLRQYCLRDVTPTALLVHFTNADSAFQIHYIYILE